MTDTPITDADLREWREACEAATPGPWEAIHNWGHPTGDPNKFGFWAEGPITKSDAWSVAEKQSKMDAEFISMARTAMPRLIDEVKRLRQELAAAREHERWIPVGERLPELGMEYYLARLANGRIEKVVYKISGMLWKLAGRSDDLSALVTHWRPLPAGPDEEE